MNIRAAFISDNRLLLDQIKKDFPDSHFYYSQNVMEFYQVIGSNKIEAIVFAGAKKLADEFGSYYSYLRQKPQFKAAPIAVFCNEPLTVKMPIGDHLVRSYPLAAGFFVSLVSLITLSKEGQTGSTLLDQTQIESIFCKALFNKVGQSQEFKAMPATDDEAHAEFLSQGSDEVASNLLWLKLTARILTEKSSELLQTVSTLPESDQQTIIEQIIISVLHDFTTDVSALLQEDGAIFFAHTDALPMADKAAYLKKAKPISIVFESSGCTFLVEFIYYIQ